MSCKVATTTPNENAVERNERKLKKRYMQQGKGERYRREERYIRKSLHYNCYSKGNNNEVTIKIMG